MTIILTLAWWHIPLAITVISLLMALYWPIDGGGGFASGITSLFMFMAALVVSLAAWAVAGGLK